MIIYDSAINKYPNIQKIFTREWFEKEIKKDKNEMHLLAKQFTFASQDGSSLDNISLQYLGHLEMMLKNLKDEIYSKRSLLGKLTNKDQYLGTFAQIEIGFLFKNMGFKVDFEPPIPHKIEKGDIKIISDGIDIFIEVTTRQGPHIEDINIEDNDSITIGKCIFRQPIDYTRKLMEKECQLSPYCPGIIVLYLHPSSIPERDNIIRGFGFDIFWGKDDNIFLKEGESIMNNSIFSAILLYIPYFDDNKYNIIKELYLNPKANYQLPNTIITKFRDCDTKIINPQEYSIIGTVLNHIWKNNLNTERFVRLNKKLTIREPLKKYISDLLNANYTMQSLAEKYKLSEIEQKCLLLNLKKSLKGHIYHWIIEKRLCEWYNICRELTEEEIFKTEEELIITTKKLTYGEKEELLEYLNK